MELFANNASTTLAAAYVPGSGTITVAGATPYGSSYGQFPVPSTGQFFRVKCAQLIWKVTAVNTSTQVWTVTVVESSDASQGSNTAVVAELTAAAVTSLTQSGLIANADISATAAIAQSKLALDADPGVHETRHIPGGADALPWASSIHASGVDASKPAASASNAGLLYFSTDIQGGTLYRSDGTTWTSVSGNSTAFHDTGDSFGIDATLGTLDNHDVIVVSDAIERARIQKGGAFNLGTTSTRGQGVYYGSFFRSTATADPGLYILVSSDGKSWQQVGIPHYTPASLRDPSITFWNNTFYVVFTNGASGAFGLASSPDLINWTTLANVSVSGTVQTWAPEWFVDTDGLHVFVAGNPNASPNDTAFLIYEVHPTALDLSTWSTAVTITGTSLPTNMIDPFMVKQGTTYNIWYKDETAKYVCYLSSSSLTSGYTVTKSGNWASWGSGLEGMSLVQVDSSTWRIYFDMYTLNGLYYSESTDGWATWSAKTLITSPQTMSHPTIKRDLSLNVLRTLLTLSLQQPISIGVGNFTASGYLAENTLTNIALTTGYDSGGFFTGTANTMTIPAAGWYEITLSLSFPYPGEATYRKGVVNKNGSPLFQAGMQHSTATQQAEVIWSYTNISALAVGDVLTVQALAQTVVNCNLGGGQLLVRRLG